MSKKRKLRRNEHRFNGRIVRPKNFKKWRKDKEYDKHKRMWIRQVREQVELEYTGTELDIEQEQQGRDYKQEIIDKFDDWAKDNMKGYGFEGRADILRQLEKADLSNEHNGLVDLDAEHTSKTADIKGKFVKLRYDVKQKTLKIVLNESWNYEV